MANTYNSPQVDAQEPTPQQATGTVTVPFSFTTTATEASVNSVYRVCKIPNGATITTVSVGLDHGVNSLTLQPKVVQSTGNASDVITESSTVLAPAIAAGTANAASLCAVLPYEVPLATDKSGAKILDDARLEFAQNAHSIPSGKVLSGSVTYTYQTRDMGVNHSASDF